MGEYDGFRAVFVGQIAHLLADLLAGLVPRDAFPLAASAVADALQGIVAALRMIEPFDLEIHAFAHPAVADGAIRVTFELRDLPILHRGEDAAVGMGCETQGSLVLDV